MMSLVAIKSFSSLPQLRLRSPASDMSPTITLIFTVFVLYASANAMAHHSHDKSERREKQEKHPTCQEFTQGLSFNDSSAIGSWHLLHMRMENSNGGVDTHCVSFTAVSDQERKDLKELIGKFVENLKWENLVLKMQIPCASPGFNKSRDYYLEKLEGDGSYRTLQMPPSSAKLDLADFPPLSNAAEGQYLGMMDCHEKFVFILGPQPPEGKEIDEKLKKMIDFYWPEETA
ncbi:hypothetical protein HW555_006017 [Spodoptera exigua]|uniref:Uncharacterized protein n=1 Tax=Spodoptera exigua TaxID=7107 RepID=A0A835L3Z0_SPOEX|nr:hypothetical protein HW555_006017 [Spodoptera exigua]